jgi:hypothetical protein
MGDGGLVDVQTKVSAGQYYIVTSKPELVPPAMVLVEDAYLECDEIGDVGVFYSILLVDLPRGAEIPELSIRVKGSVAPPILKFRNAEHYQHILGPDVFVEKLPELHLLNWTADCDDDYWVWIDDGSGERRLRPTPDGSIADARITCPSQGKIWVEPKRSTGVFQFQKLAYLCIPSGISIQIVEQCSGIGDPVHIQTRLPAGWQLEPRTRLEQIRPDLWIAPAGERVIEATLSLGRLKFPISVRIPRVSMRFHAPRGDGSIFWREDLSQDLPVVIEGRVGARCSVLLWCGHSYSKIGDLGYLDAPGLRKTSMQYFRDALATSHANAAEFQLQVGDLEPSSTGRYFASAAMIEQTLIAEPVDSLLFQLPYVGGDFLMARQLVDQVPERLTFAATTDAPLSLNVFMSGLAYGAFVFDGTIVDGLESIKLTAPRFVQSVAAWLDKVRRSASSIGNETELLEAYPADDVLKLPLRRWQEAVARIRERIKINQDVPELLLEWRHAVDYPSCEQESEIFLRVGGRELTDGARRYHDSFLENGKTRNEILARSIIIYRRLLNQENVDPVVRLITPALLQLAYYRSEHKREAAEITIPSFPPSLDRLARFMKALAAHCAGTPICMQSEGGLGIAALSTRSEDVDLDKELMSS